MVDASEKLKLLGFNNLTKTLSFNIYDICYARQAAHLREYVEYIDEAYNAQRLTEILIEVSNLIGAQVLNIAHQDYDPQGASVTMLIAEESIEGLHAVTPGSASGAVVGHLDKSHVTAHTYPEVHPHHGISTFRADIDVSTCGRISPLKALNLLIESFESDVVIMDYRVRGFTRDVLGTKHFIDHDINSIQDFIATRHQNAYDLVDVNAYQEYAFHTKMRRSQFDLDDYLFGEGSTAVPDQEADRIRALVQHEMMEIFYGRNMPQ